MNQNQEKIDLMRKYASKIKTNFTFHIKGDIPSKIIDNATKKWASGLDKNTIIGFYDTTILESGKGGYIFTDSKVVYQAILEKPKKLWYDDIKSVRVRGYEKKDCNNVIVFQLYDGTTIEWSDTFLNKTPLRDFFVDLLKIINNQSDEGKARTQYEEYKGSGATAGGLAIGAYGQVNKSFDEEKFHAAQGHGFAAERANTLYDQVTGHDARIVGDDNIKNGADRIVDGVMIQSKYCQTGSKCINECFDENGKFRYLNDGKPMQIEVPSDKYDAAVQAMEEKIRQGKIPGVTDPKEAKNIVRKGHFTYEQAKNIAKAGTVESLTYDAVNGAIIATSAFGVTAIITFATNIWNGEDFDKSLKLAAYSGLKVGGTAFITTIIAGQLSKVGLNSALVGSSEAIISIMGPKASAVLINAFRNGSNIYGAAAMKSAAKLLRGNVITAGVTVIVLSSFDVVNIFKGRISGKQLFKNLTSTTSTVGGGTAGWLGGAAIGSAIFPGVGTIVGGLIGSVAVGAGASKLSDKTLGNFIKDDADEMIGIIEKEFKSLSSDYLLSQKEAEKSVDCLSDKLDEKILKDMFASKDRRLFARNILVPIIESVTRDRKHIKALTNDQMSMSLRSLLEDISDNEEADENDSPDC